MKAKFNSNDHTTSAGWAAYMKPLRNWRERLDALTGHGVPADPPEPANGHSPSNYAHCSRCSAAIKWFRLGQHRYGSISDESLA